jgi:hypothetical protein
MYSGFNTMPELDACGAGWSIPPGSNTLELGYFAQPYPRKLCKDSNQLFIHKNRSGTGPQ